MVWEPVTVTDVDRSDGAPSYTVRLFDGGERNTLRGYLRAAPVEPASSEPPLDTRTELSQLRPVRYTLQRGDRVLYHNRQEGVWEPAVVADVDRSDAVLSYTVRLGDGGERNTLRDYLHHAQDDEGAAMEWVPVSAVTPSTPAPRYSSPSSSSSSSSGGACSVVLESPRSSAAASSSTGSSEASLMRAVERGDSTWHGKRLACMRTRSGRDYGGEHPCFLGPLIHRCEPCPDEPCRRCLAMQTLIIDIVCRAGTVPRSGVCGHASAAA